MALSEQRFCDACDNLLVDNLTKRKSRVFTQCGRQEVKSIYYFHVGNF